MDIIRNNTLLRLSKSDILYLVRDAIDNDPHYILNKLNRECNNCESDEIDVFEVKNINWNEDLDRECIDVYIEEN